jgi:HD superfamily phosphohydrolase
MTDNDLLGHLKRYRFSRELVEKVERRDILKLAGMARKEDVKQIEEALEMTTEQKRAYETSIAERLKIKPYEILIDKPNIDRYFVQESAIPVSRANEIIGNLRDISRLAEPIGRQHEFLWTMRLYAPEKLKEKARREFNKQTGIELQKPSRAPFKRVSEI